MLYDLLTREDINWREFNLQTAKEVYATNRMKDSRIKALVLDDSIKAHRGEKIEGVSCYFDPLGMATQDAFLPLNAQI